MHYLHKSNRKFSVCGLVITKTYVKTIMSDITWPPTVEPSFLLRVVWRWVPSLDIVPTIEQISKCSSKVSICKIFESFFRSEELKNPEITLTLVSSYYQTILTRFVSLFLLAANLKVALVTDPQQVIMKAAFKSFSWTKSSKHFFISWPGFKRIGYTDNPHFGDE